MFKAIAYNTTINFIAKIIATAFGLAAVAIMTRYLGTDGFGQYITIITYLMFFGIVADMGLTLITGQLLARHSFSNGGLAKHPDDESRIISNIFTFRLISALIFLAPAPIIVWFLPYAMPVKIGVFIATASFLFIALNQVLIGLYQKHLLMIKASLAEVSGRAMLVTGIAIAVIYDTGLHGIVIATALAAFIHFFINYLLSLPLVKIRLAFDKIIWKKILQLSWPLAITITFNLIYLKADILLLSLLKPETDVGLYGAAYRVIDVLVTLPFILAGIVLPQITSALHRNDAQQFHKLIQNSFDIMVIIALPLIIGVQFVAKPLMQLVAGSEFYASGLILQLLVIAAGAIYFGTIFSHIIIAIEKQKQTIWAYILVAITALTGYLIFIPKYSYFGAAAVTIYSELAIALLIFGIAFYYIKFIPNFTVAFKSLIACFFMGLGLYYLNLTLIPALGIAIIVYSMVLYLLAQKNLKQMLLK